MKKPTFCVTHGWTFFAIPVLGILCGLICFLLSEYYGGIACFSIAVIFSTPLFIWRRHLFAKILINEVGIYVSYRKVIIKKIEWKEVRDVKVIVGNQFHPSISLSKDLSFEEIGENLKANSEKFVNVDLHRFPIVFDYLHKVPIVIQGLDGFYMKQFRDKIIFEDEG